MQMGDGGQLGVQIHDFVIKTGFDQDVYVGTCLVDFYMKSGCIDEARLVFDGLKGKNAVTWTTMITAYVKSGKAEVALQLFRQRRETDVMPDRYVISSVLSACSVLDFIQGGKQGSYESFSEMTRLGWKPDGFACTSVLTSCGSLEALDLGRQVHAYTIKANIESDEFVTNGLIDMYAKCSSLIDARRVFYIMGDQNVVSYNAMIEGYSSLEKLSEALDLFRNMRLRSLPPSLLTFVSLLGVSAALYVYAKCSYVKDARLLFEEMNKKDIVVWNALFFGYTQQLENEEVLKLFSKLQLSRQKPNEFTFAALMTASSNLASLRHGQQVHTQLIKHGLDSDPFVTNAIIDMYAKCGSLEDARKTFNTTAWRDIVCWNSMISTYAHHGEAEGALQIFERMLKEGMKPNYVTFVGLLSACVHAGFVELGLHYFGSMPTSGVKPGIEHYACVVSLLGHAGKLYEAKALIESLPIKPAAVLWRTLLSSCRIAGNVELGKYAAEMAISIDPMDSGSYTLLSNIFASKGMWADVKKVREKMELEGVLKEPGCSWIEVNNITNVFIARDRTHHESNLIYLVLGNLIMQVKSAGYVPDIATPIID
ncbi:60S ribosomal protein L6-1-like [Hibiscus syriacus]|uniref:60S ribosomal protein L6-1-like n=1 Tax=Hibiscus syriacus TaxID=106335 RepID=A0A6A3AUR8_HIBSY|nr:60S ribosomal protein L6-1-like [Hibiscus syriacus]